MRLFKQDTKVEALKSAPLFQDLSRKELVQLARVSEDLEVPPGKVLCKEGEIGHEFIEPMSITRPGVIVDLYPGESAARSDALAQAG
jgi:hypothetical protein